MASFLRFFILALPPLLGVTTFAGPAFLFAAVLLALMLATQLLATLVRPRLRETPFLWVVIAQTVLLITLVDALVGWLAPGIRSAWGIYLSLLALSPLVLILPSEQRIQFRPVGLLVSMLIALGLLRELFGLGSLSLVPGLVFWNVPWLHEHPLKVLNSTAGGYFLAAAAIVLFRWMTPLVPALMRESEVVPLPRFNPDAIPSAKPKLEPIAVVQPNAEKRDLQRPVELDKSEWGENLEEVVLKLPGEHGTEKKRILVIGSGNGELVYYLAILGLEAMKDNKSFQFRVRGVDNFSTRVEAAVRGVYRDNLLEFIPKDLKEVWLTRGKEGDRNLLRVTNEPRLHVQFEVADLQAGQLTLPQPSHLTLLMKGIAHASAEKTAQFYRLIADNLVPGGALIMLAPFERTAIPEGMRRTGTTVFRKT